MWTSLQMISLGSLLLLGNQPLCGRSNECIDEKAITQQLESFQKTLDESAAWVSSSGLNTRSISPWTYTNNTDDARYPRVIFEAKCVHKGCLVNGETTDAYNSVEVMTSMNVFYKRQCAHDDKKHVLTPGLVIVPVSCVCVLPKY